MRIHGFNKRFDNWVSISFEQIIVKVSSDDDNFVTVNEFVEC